MRRLSLLVLTLTAISCSSDPSAGPTPTDSGGSDTKGDTTVDSAVDTNVPTDSALDSAADTNVPDTNVPDSPADTSVPPTESCAPTFATCTPVVGKTKFVRLMGTVVTPSIVHCDAEVIFSTETGKIACVGDCKGAPEAVDAQVACANGVIYPGLIDPHQHADYNHMPVFKHPGKYDNRNTWRDREPLYDAFKIPHRPFGTSNKAGQIKAQRYAEVRIVLSGGTTLSGTAGALLSDAGIAFWLRNVDSTNRDFSGLAGGEYVDPDTDSVIVDAKAGGTTIVAADTTKHLTDVVARFSNPNYRAFLPHIAEGIDSFARSEFDFASKLGAFTAKTSIVHCTGCSTQQFAQMAGSKTDLIWSPRSNLDLYGRTASVTTAKALGVKIALGIDWTPSGSMNPIGELQCVAKLNSTYYNNTFSDRDIVEMSTANAAASLNLEDQLGSLAKGLAADIMVVSGDRTKPYRALLDAKAQQIRLVTVAGKAVYGDPDITVGTMIGGETCQPIPDGISPDGKTGVCGTAKNVCVSTFDPKLFSDMKATLDAAKVADTKCAGASPTGSHCYAYELFPLFRCDAGPELDRCVMGHGEITRRAVGTGTIAALTGIPVPGVDDDGDGVPNVTDNCPKVFNPPFDNTTKQDDVDGDGLGDPCDPTPCGPTGALCVGDSDGDGVKDDKDNCPSTANADQKDDDSDGKGNLCDSCPKDPNPGTAACPSPELTIPEIRDPASAKRPTAGLKISVTKAVVTGVKSAGTTHAFIAQDPTAPLYGGIYVLVGAPVITVVPGDLVSFAGTFGTFRGVEQIDIRSGGIYTKTGTGTVPTPIVVAIADIVTGGPKAKSLQSMLVRVNDVEAVTATVSDLFKVATGPGATPQLSVTSFIAADLAVSPFPAVVGDKYTSITGIVYSFIATGSTDDSRLAPRSIADLIKK